MFAFTKAVGHGAELVIRHRIYWDLTSNSGENMFKRPGDPWWDCLLNRTKTPVVIGLVYVTQIICPNDEIWAENRK